MESRAEALALLGACLLAALPVILSAAHSLANGWTPVGDDAAIAVRALDVLSSHPPLLGHYSASSVVIGQEAHSPGPMLYWLLALPARLGGASAMVVTMALVNAAASAGVVVLARRRGGPLLMIVAATVVAAMSGSLVGHVYSDIWNPAAPVLPFTLLIPLAWSIGCGDHRLLPLAALVASFVTQCHLAYLAPAAGLLAIAAAGLVLARRRVAAPEPGRRWLLATAAVLLVCWAGPLIDQAVHRPGNLVVLARIAVAGEPSFGAEGGVRAVTRAVGVPPWWLRTAGSGSDRLVDVSKGAGAFATVTAALVLLALAALLLVALRRRRPAIAVAAAQALVLCVALGAVTAGTPSQGLLPLSLGYTLWWGSAVSAWAWITLLCGSLALVAGPRLRRLPARRVLVPLAAGGAIVSVAAVVAASPGVDVLESRYEPMRQLERTVAARIPDGARVRVGGGGKNGFDTGFDYEMGIVYALRRRGAYVTADLTLPVGDHYAPHGAVDWVVRVERESGAPRPPERLLQRVPTGRGDEAIVVTLAPGRPR